MKKQIKKIVLFVVVCFGFLFTSCEKELYEKPIQQQSRRINYLKGQQALNALNNTTKKMNASIKKNFTHKSDQVFDFGTVKYDIVMQYIDEFGNINNTYKVDSPDASYKEFFNLVEQQKIDGSYILKLYDYSMTPEFAEKYNNSEKPFTEFQGGFTYRLVAYSYNPPCPNCGDDGGGGGSGTNDGSTPGPIGSTPSAPGASQGSNNNSQGAGAIGGGSSGDPCDHGSGGIGDGGAGAGLGDGGDSGGASSGGGVVCTTTTINILCSEGHEHVGPCNATEPGFVIIITSCEPIGNKMADASDPCSGGTGSGGSGVLPPDPVLVTVNPCAELIAKSAETVFHNKLAQLNDPLKFALDHETGFFEKRTAGSVDYTNGSTGSTSHSLTVPPNTLAFAHVHQNDYTLPNGVPAHIVKMLSPADIKSFTINCQNYAASIGLTASSTYGIMVSSEGTYALKMLTPTIDVSSIDFETFESEYVNKSKDLITEEVLNSSTATKMLLNFLKDKNIDGGVGLFRATNADMTQWSRVALDNNGNLTETPCN